VVSVELRVVELCGVVAHDVLYYEVLYTLDYIILHVMLYRTLLLEMETGTNDLLDVARKVGGYNRLVQGHRQAWHNAYGPSPRVLVVVRTDAQIEGQARTWYTYCRIGGETSVLLTSLQLLARIYRRGRWALVNQPCWLDIMAPPERRWKTLAASLDLA